MPQFSTSRILTQHEENRNSLITSVFFRTPVYSILSWSSYVLVSSPSSRLSAGEALRRGGRRGRFGRPVEAISGAR
jgi:hypothetical protein